ncbi:MAG: 50S ribosomal protein L4 [Candidatus Aenigmarchaeota archaeon]|nr:50S ribosomal protein L4 [Candidatus Aenigmarchaeota archaeon]
MKVDVLDLKGKVVKKIELPEIFKTEIRPDLIQRAFLAIMSHKRQPYGTDPLAGLRTSAHYHGMRHSRYTMMNRELARMPRLHGDTAPGLFWAARKVPQAVKGRRAHPPKVEKVWEEKINKKERRKAIASAIAATAVKELVEKRGHRIDGVKSLPIVVVDDLEKISKTKELREFLERIGLKEELERVKERKVRAGKGKRRGRKYKKKIGPLIVVGEDKGIGKAAKNLPGVHVCRVENLNAEYLAPGAMPGRLTIFTLSAINKLKEGKLFGG